VATQFLVIGDGGEADPFLADEDTAADVLTPDVDGTLLVRAGEEPKYLIKRHKAQVSRKSHLFHSLRAVLPNHFGLKGLAL
jgi:hypothetical protein